MKLTHYPSMTKPNLADEIRKNVCHGPFFDSEAGSPAALLCFPSGPVSALLLVGSFVTRMVLVVVIATEFLFS